MRSMSESQLEEAIKEYEDNVGAYYDIKIWNPENVQAGRAIYVANHRHNSDPTFLMYGIIKEGKVLVHQFAKLYLFRIPVLGKELKRMKTIPVPTPKRRKKSHKERREDILKYTQQMDGDIVKYLSMDEPISWAYSGTRMDNALLTEENKQAEINAIKTGVIKRVQKKFDKSLEMYLVPVAIETYEKDSNLLFLKSLLMKKGFYKIFPPRQKKGVDVMFGEPIFMAEYLSEGNNIYDLVKHSVEEIWDMRKEIHDFYKKNPDPTRDLDSTFAHELSS